VPRPDAARADARAARQDELESTVTDETVEKARALYRTLVDGS
jgi:hypothetical protein